MGVTVESLDAAVLQELGKLPRVTGSGREADRYYVARPVDEALNRAEKLADEMKDDFVSVEHLLLALIETADSTLKRLFSAYNITKERFLQALQSVRGNQRVTSDSPEDTYEALEKYGTDLVKRAREQKMDPVIGRDEEIRNVIHLERSNVAAANGLSIVALLLFNRHDVVWVLERYHETIGAHVGLTVHTGCLDHVGLSVNKFRDLIVGGRRVGDKHQIVNAGGRRRKIPLAAVVGELPGQRICAVEAVSLVRCL